LISIALDTINLLFNTKMLAASLITNLLILSLGFMPVFTDAAHSTVVALTDAELRELLQIVFHQLGGSTIIPITLLESLGLNTVSVISLLQSIGYSILY